MAEVTQKVVEIRAKIEGEKSVKDLKQQVAELTQLMDNLDKESLEYHRTVDMLVDAQEELTTVMKVGKSQLSAQEGSYNALVNRMAALKKAHKAVADEASRSRLSAEIDKINTALKEMDAKNGVYVRNVGNYENAVKAALKTPQQELKALRVQLAQLTEGTAEYNAVFMRMADLTHQVTEQQEKLRWSSSDLGDILGNLTGVATSIAGGFSAFNALSGLFGGGESEELEKAMLQAQRFIQLVQGLEQLEQLADKIKGLWSGIKNFVNTTTVGTAALTDFQQETEKAEAASTGAASAINANTLATNTGAEATDKAKDSLKALNEEQEKRLSTLQQMLILVGTSVTKESEYIIELEKELEVKKKIGTKDAIRELEKEIDLRKKALVTKVKNNEAVVDEIRELKKKTNSVKEDTEAIELNHKGLKGRLATMILNSKQNKASVAEINAMTTAQLTSSAATVAWSSALGILKTALISTGIGAIIVALGSLLALLGKGLGKVWDWISGANKAEEQTTAIKKALDDLNESLNIQEKAWERQEMLMEAQGKTYEEIYEARKKNLQAQLAETQALLASQKAIANDIGQRKLQKDKYEEFRETLEELTEKEKELKEAIDDLDYKNYIDDLKATKKAEEDRIAASKKAAEEAQKAKEKEKAEADKLYKSLIEHYKTEKQKLKEKYEEEKKLLEKYGKDTTLLTKKYEEDKTNIVLKEAELRRKADERRKNIELSLLTNPSLEYYDTLRKNAVKAYNELVAFNNKIIENPKNIKAILKEAGDAFGTQFDNYNDFLTYFKVLKKGIEDAKEGLNNYAKQVRETVSSQEVALIEKEVEAISQLIEMETTLGQLEYETYQSKYQWFWAFSNNYITQMYERWDAEDAIFEKRQARLREEMEIYKEAAQNTMLTEEARLEALQKAAQIEQQIQLESKEHTIEVNYRKGEAVDNYVATVQDSLNGIGDILSNVASAWETSIKAQVDAGEISEEEGERQMENMRGIQSAIAMINALSSAVSAYNSMASIPFVGPVLGAAAAAAALASGLAQVKAINAVKKGANGGGDSVRYAEVVPSVPDYNPQGVTNVTGGQETENLANALSGTNLWVSVKDIDSAQGKVKTREKETSF